MVYCCVEMCARSRGEGCDNIFGLNGIDHERGGWDEGDGE